MKTMSRIFVCFFMTYSIFISFLSLEVNGQRDAHLMLDGKGISLSVEPVTVDGRLMVPLRGIFERMGATVTWDSQDKRIEIMKDGMYLVLRPGEKEVIRNGESVMVDVPPRMIRGHTFVPLRFISESFSVKVKWNNHSKQAEIITYTIEEAQTLDDLFIVLEFEDYQLSVLDRSETSVHFFLLKDEMFNYFDDQELGLYSVHIYEATKREYVQLASKLLRLRGVPIEEDFKEMVHFALENPEQLHKKQYGDYLVQFISTEDTDAVTVNIGGYFPEYEK